VLRRLVEEVGAAGALAAIRALPGKRGGRAAILMYHNVCALPEGLAGFYQHVRPAQFAEQMEFLEQQGYQVVPLRDFVAKLEGGRPLPARTVAITFDDGYAGLLSAWPELERRGYPATIFLATGHLGQPSFRWLEGGWAPQRSIAPLTWEQAAELGRRGARFGSHTVSHRPLDGMDDAALQRELVQSRQAIEDRLGQQARLFSLPFACPEAADFRRRLCWQLRQAGYRAAVTTAIGTLCPGADLMALPRLPVNALDTPTTFQAKLEGAYDWLRPVQRGYKLWLKPLIERRASRASTTPPSLRGTP